MGETAQHLRTEIIIRFSVTSVTSTATSVSSEKWNCIYVHFGNCGDSSSIWKRTLKNCSFQRRWISCRLQEKQRKIDNLACCYISGKHKRKPTFFGKSRDSPFFQSLSRQCFQCGAVFKNRADQIRKYLK